jgi:hypothetical protein
LDQASRKEMTDQYNVHAAADLRTLRVFVQLGQRVSANGGPTNVMLQAYLPSLRTRQYQSMRP